MKARRDYTLTPCSEGSTTPKNTTSNGRERRRKAGGGEAWARPLSPRADRARRTTPNPTQPDHPPPRYAPPHPDRGPTYTHRVATLLNAWHRTTSAFMAEGDALTEEEIHLMEAVVVGYMQGNVLHGVLYS